MGCVSSSALDAANSGVLSGKSVHANYDFGEKLGQGSFGQVRECKERATGDVKAVKILDMRPENSSSSERTECRKDAHSECRVWRKVGSHQHIVVLHEIFMDKRFMYFVMERCEHSLLDVLLAKENVKETDMLRTFRQMLLGIRHCHSEKVIHRDIKPSNYLLGSDGLVKLCDFGLSVLESTETVQRGVAGTAPFMSPEMVTERPYTCKTDIWSFGASIYLMLYGKYPYHAPERTKSADDVKKGHRDSPQNEMRRRIAKGADPPYQAAKGVAEPSEKAQKFVQAVLRRSCHMRLSADEILKLPAMKEVMERPAVPSEAEKEVLEDARTVQAPPRLNAEPELSPSLKPAVRLAKQMTEEFKTRVDPTVAKSMDELLDQLQAQYRGNLARGFSTPTTSRSLMLSDSRHSVSRCISHSGEVSVSVSRFGSAFSDESSVASSVSSRDEEDSTTASSRETEAPGKDRDRQRGRVASRISSL